MTQTCRVGISGSYGGLNLGDEAILEVIVRELRRSLPVELTVFSRNPEDTLQRHEVEHAIPVRDLSRQEVLQEVKGLDLLILGGGGIIFDEEAQIYLREMEVANEVGVPAMVYAVSAGPLKDPAAQKLVRQTLGKAAAITVRDREAQKVLESAGVQREITVTADPAVLLEPEELPEEALKTEGLDPSRRLVGMSVRERGVAAPDISEQHYHALLANAADYIIERVDASLVFVPMEPAVLDTQQSHVVIGQMANATRATVLKGRYTSGQILSLVKHFSFVVGMRLHFLIFAAIQRVPLVALPYAGKISGFLELLEMKTGPMDEMSIGRLIAHIDRSWDLQEELRARIDRHMPAIQERARENNRIAVELLRKR
jgi:polysaccharide pyruvyl transferase CsaB